MSSVGRECLEHADCQSGYCQLGRCSVNVAKKPCASPTAACPPGTHCDSVTRHCLSPTFVLPSEGCQNAWDCPWGKYCNKFHKCADRFGAGHRCSKDKQCGERLACDDKRCTAKCLNRANCETKCDCIRREDGILVCRLQLEVPPPPGLLPLYVVIPITIIMIVLLFFMVRFIGRFCRRKRNDNSLVPILRSSPPATPIIIEEHDERPQYQSVELTPVEHHRPQATVESREFPVADSQQRQSSSPPRKNQDHDLPVWPETTIKLPDPFDEEIPNTPIERKEFSSPLNIGAPIHADERSSFVLPKDPSLDSQALWQ